ncbi:helix-turn-helix domain-containing protein [Sorangium cellulosum]|uniref:helix-turn-helix domain-containing protein n=1 Tax=Sorangium cellulosum TaxID=56 RepID=UPI003D9A7496
MVTRGRGRGPRGTDPVPGRQSETASWPDLLAFVDSVRAGSFSAAAREAGKTPSAFSKRVTRLEEQLKLRLVARGAGPPVSEKLSPDLIRLRRIRSPVPGSGDRL